MNSQEPSDAVRYELEGVIIMSSYCVIHVYRLLHAFYLYIYSVPYLLHTSYCIYRAVNSVLTALDALKRRPNVLVLCTSNLLDAIDPAFRDRLDLLIYMGPPAEQARWVIIMIFTRYIYLNMPYASIYNILYACYM